MMTRLLLTSTTPPCTAATSSPPPVRVIVTGWICRAPRNGACPGRKAMSPAAVRHDTISASPENKMRSGLTSSTCIGMPVALFLHLGGLGHDVVETTDGHERLLGD